MRPIGAKRASVDEHGYDDKVTRGRENNDSRRELAEEVAHADRNYIRYSEYAYHDRALISDWVIEASIRGECPCCRMAA